MAKNMLSIKRMKRVLNAYQNGVKLQAKDMLNPNGWCDVLNSNFNFNGDIIYRKKENKKILFGFNF